MERYNQLPTDMKYEIVKYSPLYRTLNKSLHQDTTAYYARFCSQSINFKEFSKILYGKSDFSYIFTPKIDGFYVIQIIGAFNIVKIYDFLILNNTLYVIMDETDLEEFDTNKYMNKNSYYDMLTSLHILHQRDCHYPNYIRNQILKDIDKFSEDISTTDITSFMYNIEKFIYFFTADGYNVTKNFVTTFTDYKFNDIGLLKLKIYQNLHFDITYDKLLDVLDERIEQFLY